MCHGVTNNHAANTKDSPAGHRADLRHLRSNARRTSTTTEPTTKYKTRTEDIAMKKHTKLSAKVQNKLKTLEKARLPELRAEYAKIVGETTRSPNRTFLLRKIAEALSSNAAPKQLRPRKAAQATQTQDDAAPATPAPKQRGRFTGLSVAELKAKYREVIGRDTGSDDRAYLIWKIREAENGRIPIGPRPIRAAGDMTTLPFRIPTTASDAMDEAWHEQGVKSRNRFLQDAVSHYLTHLGYLSAAAQFATTPAQVAS
jgi:hypothetical protein